VTVRHTRFDPRGWGAVRSKNRFRSRACPGL
jgi:hypothetical protein